MNKSWAGQAALILLLTFGLLWAAAGTAQASVRELPIGKFRDRSEPSCNGVVCAAEVGCSWVSPLGPTVIMINNPSEQEKFGLLQPAVRFLGKSFFEGVFRRGIRNIESASFTGAYDQTPMGDNICAPHGIRVWDIVWVEPIKPNSTTRDMGSVSSRIHNGKFDIGTLSADLNMGVCSEALGKSEFQLRAVFREELTPPKLLLLSQNISLPPGGLIGSKQEPDFQGPDDNKRGSKNVQRQSIVSHSFFGRHWRGYLAGLLIGAAYWLFLLRYDQQHSREDQR